ncbi:hypothetical protein TanjilG_32895 [Lupinus angustifolius]|uniref:Arabidopsis retrotransposon Orf1 C-terminal domain-containing protein n=1 Tax=Lupinus angustifolius TaxID=3871 RepID=A0A4P1RP64_LUPAN|nr:hypothetical protein TanjilG_32895 [Lupinus angustifolius]
MVLTRYMDDTDLDNLRLRDSFNWLLPRVGQGTFMTARDITYVELTLEFPSSLEVEILHGPHCNASRLAFKLRDTKFAFTLAEFYAMFCFLVGDAHRPLKKFQAHKLWDKVAVDTPTYDPSNWFPETGSRMTRPAI